MSKFVRNFEIRTEFDGDSVVAVVRPMDFPTALRFQQESKGLTTRKFVDEKGEEHEELESPMELLPFFRDSLSSHLVSISGLRDSAGVELTKEDMLCSAYFVSLVTSIASEWMERSTPGKK